MPLPLLLVERSTELGRDAEPGDFTNAEQRELVEDLEDSLQSPWISDAWLAKVVRTYARAGMPYRRLLRSLREAQEQRDILLYEYEVFRLAIGDAPSTDLEDYLR